MPILSSKRRDEVETVIRSCLIAHQGNVSIQQLNKDYEEFEGETIPYQEFNFKSLIAFLQSLSNVLKIEINSNQIYVRPIDSEKSRHVSSLVEGQRSKRPHPRRSQRPYLGFSGSKLKVSISSKLLMSLVKEVNLYPDGINIDWAVQYLNKISRPVQITRSELERQLGEISHEVVIRGNYLYPARRSQTHSQRTYITDSRYYQSSSQCSVNDIYQRPTNRPEGMPERNSYVSPKQTSNDEKDLPMRFTGEDEDATGEDDAETNYLAAGYTKTTSPPKQNGYKDHQTSKQNYEGQQISNRERDVSYQETANPLRDYQERSKEENKSYRRQYENTYTDELELHEKSHKESQRVPNVMCDGDDYEDEDPVVNDDMMYEDCDGNRSLLINDKTRKRLAILIQHHPEGIWCADLPQKYLEASGVTLNYMELGFDSVREYASQLPEIFHCIRPTDAGDYKLYDAQKPPPDLCNKEQPTRLTLAAQYRIYDDVLDEPEVFPGRLDPSTTGKLIPEGVMEVRETVGHISVTELGKDQDYEEVEVSEVFTPSFFWIQLRKKLPRFRKFMDDLHSFYESNKSKYKIPLIMLERGLNVACVYADKWHRGIIKSVLPDARSHVHFYDYGTVKTYNPDDLYFLHRQFSYLPAQAIPCGLYNVKPYNATKWSRTITWEFVSKTSVPLIATIGSRDEEENSMLVSLTDTRGEEDFHINDWMYSQKFADQGRMVRIRNRNFAFAYYTKCLERKGYDPSAIHNCAEFDESNMNNVNDNNANAKNLAVSSINDKQHFKESEDSSKNPFLRVCENSSTIEKFNLKEPENACMNPVLHREKYNLRELNEFRGPSPDLRQSPLQDEDNFFKTRSKSAYKDSTCRDYKFLKSNKVSENNPKKSSPADSPCDEQLNKDSSSTDYKFEKSDRVVESKPDESTPGPCILKRTLALLAQYQVKQEKENVANSMSPSKDTSGSSEYKNTSESFKTSPASKSISSVESESKVEMLKRFMMKKQNINTDYAESPPQCSAPIMKLNLDSKNQIESKRLALDKKLNLHSKDQVLLPLLTPHKKSILNSEYQVESQHPTPAKKLNLISRDHLESSQPAAPCKKPDLDFKDQFQDLPKLKSIPSPLEKLESPPLITDASDSDSISDHSPLLLKEKPEEKKETTFFGTLKSECGGSGRMEPMDWRAIRTALEESEGQFSTTKSRKGLNAVDLSPKLSKRDVPLVKPEIIYLVDSNSNSTYYEKGVKFLPAGNVKHSRTSISPLLKLKQRLHANSYKHSAILVSSKLVSILRGELQNVCEEDDASSTFESEKPLDVSENLITEEEIEAKEEEDEFKKMENQMPRKVHMFLEAQKMRTAQLANYIVPSGTEEKKKTEVKKNDVSGLLKGFVEKQIEFVHEFANKMSQGSSEEQKQPAIKSKKKRRTSRGKRSKSSSPDLPKSFLGKNKAVEKDKITKSLNKEEPKSLENEELKIADEPELSKLMKLVDVSHDLTKDFEKKDQLILNLADYPPVKTTRSLLFERLNNIKSPTNSVGSLDSDDLSSLDDKDECLITECETILLPAINYEKSLKEDTYSTEKFSPKPQEVIQNQNSETKIDKNTTPLVNVNKVSKEKILIQELDHQNSKTKIKKQTTPLVKLDAVSKENILSKELAKSRDENVDNEQEEILLNPQVLSTVWKNIKSDKRPFMLESEASSTFNHNSLTKETEPENISSKSDLNNSYEEMSSDSKQEKDSKTINFKLPQNPVPNRLSQFVASECVFNDLDVTSDDEEQWDVMSYMSSESYQTDPVFRLSKNYRRNYNQMVEDHRMRIEEIPTEDNNVSKSKVPGIENNKSFKENITPTSSGIMPLNFKYPDQNRLSKCSIKSISSRISSPDTVQNSVNGNNQKEFVNFQYTPEMKPNKQTKKSIENSSSEEFSEKTLHNHSPSLDSEDFMFNSSEISTLVEKWEPPGRAKTLKNMLLQMSQQ